MESTIVGTRIRQRRRERGIRQADLAKSIGISPSYMNLIEWNRRRVSEPLLRKVASCLQTDIDELTGAPEGRLVEALQEIAQEPKFAEIAVETERTHELVGRFPGWSRRLAALARSERDAAARARNLSDRLGNNPFLSETLHRMLTRISSIRSTAEILTEFDDLPQDRRQRFDRIIEEESRTLSEVGEALAVYLDKSEDADQALTPLDEVEAFFESRQNHFAEMEDLANRIAGLSAMTEPKPSTVARRTLAQSVASEHMGREIKAFIRQQKGISTSVARSRAERALLIYGVGALLMPLNEFKRQAQDCRFDIEALAQLFSVDIEDVCRRLTSLPREDDLPQFGYFRSNASGTIIEVLGLTGLTRPRYSALCPLWVLFRAQQSPDTVIRQRALFPSGARFVFVARARHTGATGFGKPRQYLTDMVAMTEKDSMKTVYAPDAAALVEEIGPNCRLCPRKSCDHRVEDPLAD